MSVFADTSGLYALLLESEEGHADVVRVFRNTLIGDRPLWTTSYVLVETIALLQSRVGLEPVRDFDEHVLPMLSVEWVSESLHRRGARRVLKESRRRLSLVSGCGRMESSRKVTEHYIVKLGESIYAIEAESRRDAARIATIHRNHTLNYSFASDPERISDDHFESYLVDEYGRSVRAEDQPEPEVWKEWEYRNQYGDEQRHNRECRSLPECLPDGRTGFTRGPGTCWCTRQAPEPPGARAWFTRRRRASLRPLPEP